MNTTKTVKFYARTIVAKIRSGKLLLGVADFSRTRFTAAGAGISVEFEAGISREEAMAGLAALLKEIEADGLPETSLSIRREDARSFDEILRGLAGGKRNYDRLSPRGQQYLRELCALQNQGEDRPFSQELFRLYRWSIEVDVGAKARLH